jgi:8-oxo-dGTP pyrophosphatase MutT (NUDIX family)
MRRILDMPLRLVLTGAHQVLRARKAGRGHNRTFGAHALALTSERRLILVKLRYATGWRLPGGGRDEKEDGRAAVLRELREEIGMHSHGTVTAAADLELSEARERDVASLFVVRDVAYRPPAWSWEVEQVIETPLDDLPHDLATPTARWLAAVRGAL